MGTVQNKFNACVCMYRYGIFSSSTSSHPRLRMRRLPMLQAPPSLRQSVTARGASTHTKSSNCCVGSGLRPVSDIAGDVFKDSYEHEGALIPESRPTLGLLNGC